jgi:hypothetical protein
MTFRDASLSLAGLLCITTFSFAQQGSLKVMAEVPLQFGVGYEGSVTKRFSVALSVGVLTPPNSTLIIDVLKDLGTDPDITAMIQETFKLGIVGKMGINYNFKRNYIGGVFEVVGLQAGDVSTSLVEKHYGVNLENYPRKGKATTTTNDLTLRSTLYQAGVLYGRRFPFRNKRYEIDTEFAFTANIGSKSTLYSNSRNVSSLSSAVNAELSGYYSSYAFVPSLLVAFVYKLNKH